MDNLGQFEASLAKWVPSFNKKLDELVRNVAFVVSDNIVNGGKYGPGTPIRTGYARASWWFSIGSPGLPHQAARNPLTPFDQWHGKADLSKIAEFKAGQIGFLLSNTVYMPALEYGWSGQAPSGMIRVVLAQAQQILNDVAVATKAA